MFYIILVSLFTFITVTFSAVLPLGDSSYITTHYDLKDVIQGECPARLRDDQSLEFSTQNGTTSAILPGTLDISKGIKVDLEILCDYPQTNSYPRIFETGAFSLQICTVPNSLDMQVKILLSGKNASHIQAIAPCKHRPKTWRKLTATYEPEGKRISIQIDNADIICADILPLALDTRPHQALLGSNDISRNGLRGFTGCIRNVAVTTPYDPQPSTKDMTALMAPPSHKGKLLEHFTICRMKGRHLAFPGAAIMPNGDWAVVFREGEEHVCPYGRICITFSKDHGKNWSAPVAIVDTESDERDPSLQTLPDGRVLLTHGGWNSWLSSSELTHHYSMASAYIQQSGPQNYGRTGYLFSSDNGHTWSEPIRKTPFSPHGPLVHNGKLYQPYLGYSKNTRKVLMRIGDAMATHWEGPFLIGESDTVLSVFEEPHCAALADGTLVTAIRVPQDGYMRISRSLDDGKTWSQPVKTPVKGFPQHLLSLPDGCLLATYGYRFAPLGIHACFSHDGGLTWDMDNEIILQNNGAHADLGYPVSVLCPDGRIWTVYYHNTHDTMTPFIEGVIWEP